MDPYLWLVALSSAGGLYVLLLLAHRKIPRPPTPDSINELRADFYELADQFVAFVEKHDQDMGRYHAKVGQLRRKLRRLQEEEGLDDEEEEEVATEEQLAPAPLLTVPPRAAQKQQVLRAVQSLRQQKG